MFFAHGNCCNLRGIELFQREQGTEGVLISEGVKLAGNAERHILALSAFWGLIYLMESIYLAEFG